MPTAQPVNCKNCHALASGRYCFQCGQKLATGRITLHSIFHEIFHYFTHVDKGFGFTLKQLATRPGRMQREYVDGKRANHQKPFSMFFLCGTICGLAYYFINLAYHKIYQSNTEAEANFFRHYFVLLQAVMLPFYTLVIWLLFRNSKKNYAEALVLTLYSLSFAFLAFIIINAAKLVFPGYENRYVEVAFLLFYINLTHLRFFEGSKWLIIGKTIVMLSIIYATSQVVSQLFINWLQ